MYRSLLCSLLLLASSSAKAEDLYAPRDLMAINNVPLASQYVSKFGDTVDGSLIVRGSVTGGVANGGVAFYVSPGQSIRCKGQGATCYIDFSADATSAPYALGAVQFRTYDSVGGLIAPLTIRPTSVDHYVLDQVMSPAGCNADDGHYNSDGTLSWVPTCSGVFNAPYPSITVLSVAGAQNVDNAGSATLINGVLTANSGPGFTTQPGLATQPLVVRLTSGGGVTFTVPVASRQSDAQITLSSPPANGTYSYSWWLPLLDNGVVQSLIQTVTRREDAAETGLFVQMYVNHGLTNLSGNGQKSAFQPFLFQDAGGGNAWVMNPDGVSGSNLTCLTAANNNGHSTCPLFLIYENDTSFFHPFGVDDGFSGGAWNNYLSDSPVGFGILWSGASDSYYGTVTVSGSTVTFGTSSSYGYSKFTGDLTTINIGCTYVPPANGNGQSCTGGTFYHINPGSMNAAGTSFSVAGTPPQGTQQSYWNTHLMTNGLIFSGDNVVSGTTIIDNSSSYYGLYFGGRHQYAITTTADTAPYAFTTAALQSICHYGNDACEVFFDGVNIFQYQFSGSPVLQQAGVVNAANYVRLTNSASGVGPLIQSYGSDASSDLRLSGYGSGVVRILGGLTAAALPTSAGGVNGSVCADVSGVIYVKTTTGPCK